MRPVRVTTHTASVHVLSLESLLRDLTPMMLSALRAVVQMAIDADLADGAGLDDDDVLDAETVVDLLTDFFYLDYERDVGGLDAPEVGVHPETGMITLRRRPKRKRRRYPRRGNPLVRVPIVLYRAGPSNN